MLVIRKEQMEVLRAHAKERSLRRMSTEIRRKTPGGIELSEEDFLALLRKGMETAAEHGFQDSFSMQAYLGLVARAGRDLGSDAEYGKWAWPILEDQGRTPSEKLAELEWALTECSSMRQS